MRTIAYGSSALPSMPGHAELTCRTWRPLKSSIMEEAGTFSRSASVRFWKLHPEVRDSCIQIRAEYMVLHKKSRVILSGRIVHEQRSLICNAFFVL